MSSSSNGSGPDKRSRRIRKRWSLWERKTDADEPKIRNVALTEYTKFSVLDNPAHHSNVGDQARGARSTNGLNVSFSVSQQHGTTAVYEDPDYQRAIKRRQSQWDEYLNTSDLQTSIQSGVFKVTLHQLARDGEAQTLKSMLDAVPDQQRRRILNTSTDEEKITALHLAARNNHYDVCKLLINCGMNVDAQTESWSTPLHYAARYKDKKRPETEDGNTTARVYANEPQAVIALLADSGAHVNTQDIEGQTPLHAASIKGNEDAVKQLLQCRGISIECFDHQGMTALHMAATHGHENIVRQLIEAGADLHCTDNDQMTPLHFACSDGSIPIVKMILEEGEKQGTIERVKKMMLRTDAGGNTCLHVSVGKGHKEMVMYLLNWCEPHELHRFVNMARSHNDTALHIAAAQGHVDISLKLIDSGANVNRRNDSLQTPLLLAAQHNNFKIVELLLQRNAQLEIRDKDNLTPLLVVTKYGHLETIAWLIENGADTSATDKNDKNCLLLAVEEKRTYAVQELLRYESVRRLLSETDKNANSVVHVAARKGYIPIIRILLQCGAKIDPKNEDEATPVHIAAMYGQHVALKELLDHDKTMLNSLDENANTALHLAAIEGHAKCIQVLLEHGANVGLRNTKQWTALDCACAKGWETTVMELLHAQSPINPPRGSRTTPLHQACINGHPQVVKLLLNWKADVGAKVTDGRNPLDCAIDGDNKECVQAILSHTTWNVALRNAYIDPMTDLVTTPTRKLIIKMPDMAELAFSRCITNNMKPPDDPKLEVTFDYEFLDDMYTILEWGHQNSALEDSGDVAVVSTKKTKLFSNPAYEAFTDQGALSKNAVTYVEDSGVLRHNHPLSIMVNRKREGLLQHPVVTALLQYKWNKYGGMVYYTRLLLLMAFVALLNFYLLMIPPPYAVDFLKSLANRRFYLEFHSGHIINYTAPKTCYSLLRSGAEYRGYDNVAESGNPCLPWDSTSTNSQLFPDAGLDSNFCRNPGTQKDQPWCYTNYSDTDAAMRVREECNVTACKIYVHGQNVPLGVTCHFPFKFENAEFDKCLTQADGTPWCSYVYDFDADSTKWGTCSEESSLCSVERDQKRPCGAPDTDRLNCEARDCCYVVHDEGRPTEWSECFQKLDPCTDRTTYCPVFKQLLLCITKPEQMLTRCAKTCGFCNATEVPDQDSEYKRFLYLMSIYPENTFEPSWRPGRYFVRPGAQQKWGESALYKDVWQDPIRITLIAMCVLNLHLLLLQIWNYRLEAFQPIFFLESILFTLGLLLSINFAKFDLVYTREMESEEELYVALVENFQDETGLRQNWQWQCGVMALFLSWMNLLLYIRKIPYLGIYVVMFNDVFKTFFKFSLVFLLFILSFAFTYHTLLQNQSQFEQPFSAILKTTVMMVGEIDFGGIFFNSLKDYNHLVNYEIVTYIIFSSFIIVMMIIVMNLLVGLAVGDIIEVKEHATLERLKMQVELALEVEFSVPDILRKRFVRKKEVHLPNRYRKSNPLTKAIFHNSSLSSKNIVNAMNPNKSETEEIRDSVSQLSYAMKNVRNKTNDVDLIVRDIVGEMREMKVAMETLASTSTTRLDGLSTPGIRSARGSWRREPEDPIPPPDGFQAVTADVLRVPEPDTRPYELTDIVT